MKTTEIDGIRWPVAEPGDFDTRDGNQHFTVMEDEEGSRFYAYGHVDQVVMLAEVTRYCDHMCGGDVDNPVSGWVHHVYAKFVDTEAERFSWDGATSETPHAWPLTVVVI